MLSARAVAGVSPYPLAAVPPSPRYTVPILRTLAPDPSPVGSSGRGTTAAPIPPPKLHAVGPRLHQPPATANRPQHCQGSPARSGSDPLVLVLLLFTVVAAGSDPFLVVIVSCVDGSGESRYVASNVFGI